MLKRVLSVSPHPMIEFRRNARRRHVSAAVIMPTRQRRSKNSGSDGTILQWQPGQSPPIFMTLDVRVSPMAEMKVDGFTRFNPKHSYTRQERGCGWRCGAAQPYESDRCNMSGSEP